jgi:hypothetical protein
MELGHVHGGNRHSRSTKLYCKREALTQGNRVYRVDVDFRNAFNAMSQAALLKRAYGIPDIDLFESLYKHSTVRMASSHQQCPTITSDTGVAQGSAMSPLLFLIFMNALIWLVIDKGARDCIFPTGSYAECNCINGQ